MTANPRGIALDPAAQAFAEATDAPPYLYELPPEDGRAAVDEVQSGDGVEAPEVDEQWVTAPGGPTGSVRVRVVRPPRARGLLPVIVYVHGAGWVFGNAHTHDRLVRELATQAHAAVVFPEYDRSPEVRYPVALEQCYAAAQWVCAQGALQGLDSSHIAVAGDSVGGNLAIALTLLAKERGDVRFAAQVEFYPVTDAAFGTSSYEEFAEGYFLRRDAMRWFWDQYTTDEGERALATVSPLRAGPDDLRDLPPALVITAEADVLRDEGEAFAVRLRQAGVSTTAVRYAGVIHDFVMLDALRDTGAARAAVTQAATWLREHLKA
ncbi:Acetyl esterase/lipase [Actinopolymorpha cephalotaxi]|uniref:Acetyl esterase/lipase n=1 Tax=Actinopolymorpha cephalotaxi TaxID=504797 RepID=A0A1I2LD93_9ACTN|nr:alpha/beta hydrolase [Actinopolymorpha cephalotaxi]NYH84944.1 acetyl esterase/lipase [Actinopolymorpha cephalotaxi]SFF77215.1 Acetyl esterase/lipase [Actinopolymorpha cephalotaxi]